MAGQLTIDTLKASSGVLATQNGMTGICKAWVNWNGQGGATIRSSFNISSITYNGTGDYTLNFTTAMANANYVITFGSDAINNNDARGQLVEKSYDGNSYRTASSIRVIYGYTFTSGATEDGAWSANAAIFGA